MPDIFFEDLAVGASGQCGPRPVTRDEIVAFARDFDPQPFHLDEEAAKGTFVGELIASGWQTCALVMRIMYDGMIAQSSSMGSPGVEEVKWLGPVRPGDSLTAHWEVLETRVSKKRPDMGLVRMRIRLFDQRGLGVYEQLFWMMAGLRGAASPHGEARQREADAGPAAMPKARPEAPAALSGKALIAQAYFHNLVEGETHELGSYTFTPEPIVAFAKIYDPQPFHVDPDSAARSHFGALCASGWHTGAACMRKLIDRKSRIREALLAQGLTPPAMGPSPGFKDLVWHRPVYAGDTITFATSLVSKRESASRPGWGLTFSRNTGTNQKGELVYSFVGSVFVETRGP